jgi:hypothetical protein
LKHENIDLNKNINDNCTTLPTNTKDLINSAITCNDEVNKLIMNDYVQKEVCSQIKNFPDVLPEQELLPPSNLIPSAEIIKSQQVTITPSGPQQDAASINKLDDSYYSYGMTNFAPF